MIGLALLASSTFMAQASAVSHVGAHVEEGRGAALGLYATSYYAGGTVGGALPAFALNAGGWPACVAFVVCVQLVMLGIGWGAWAGKVHA